MSLLVACLYLLVIAFLFGSSIFVLSRDPFERINQAYAGLSLAQVLFVGSLFVFTATPVGTSLLWIGRINFAAAGLVAPAVSWFVYALLHRRHRYSWLLIIETIVVSAATLLTGSVDRSETISAGVHTTTFGPLALLYFLHLLIYLLPACYRALTQSGRLLARQRKQATLVGYGLLVTVAIGITTNVVIPYMYGDFRFIDAGGLATIIALAAISYASLVYKLFDIRVVLRAAFVYGAMIAVALELYSLAVDALTEFLPLSSPEERHAAAAIVAFIINAFSSEPIKAWLSQIADRVEHARKHQ